MTPQECRNLAARILDDRDGVVRLYFGMLLRPDEHQRFVEGYVTNMIAEAVSKSRQNERGLDIYG